MADEEFETREKLKLLNMAKEWLRTAHWEGNIQSLVNLILSFTEPKDKRIEELEKENKELNERICKVAQNLLDSWCKGDDPCPHLKKRDEQLIKAKELLNFWVNDFYDAFNSSNRYEKRHTALVQSEQFIKEVEK